MHHNYKQAAHLAVSVNEKLARQRGTWGSSRLLLCCDQLPQEGALNRGQRGSCGDKPSAPNIESDNLLAVLHLAIRAVAS